MMNRSQLGVAVAAALLAIGASWPAHAGQKGAVRALSEVAACPAVWKADSVYTVGDRVSYQSKEYVARWWTRGDIPGASEPWTLVGGCGDGGGGEPPLTQVPPPTGHALCRPDGLYFNPNVNVPYCQVYDTEGREKMGNAKRRVIGYFTSWRTGKDGAPAYLVKDIPWDKVTHINFAFAHVDGNNRLSVGNAADPNNAATGMQWPGVAGAEMDPNLPYKGHFNLLNKFKQQYPHVKTLVSVGGWAETGGYFGADGKRVSSGGFYSMTTHANGSINQAGINTFADSAVAFLRQYGFNGVDIDYEYPTSMRDAGNPLDWVVANARRAGLNASYNALMKTLREKLDAAGAQDGKYYLLTVAAPASGYLLRGMENFQALQYLDYVNIMSYDLHGAWNEFVGPNAALFDDGKDAELARWSVYTTPQYGGIGYLNTDWAYHYFRGALQGGRINVGVPYYTRGWRNVSGGTNGLWGRSVGSNCPTGLTSCGDGARGIDNLWHDDDEQGREVGAGSNPMWHAKNLEKGLPGSYIGAYGLTPDTDPEDRLTGTYTRYYDNTLVAPWLWNPQKQVFLSTEDEQSVQKKAQWIASNNLGGVMFWELAGDYEWYPSRNGGRGEYFMGSKLTRAFADAFTSATPYGNKRNPRTIPNAAIDVGFELLSYQLGDSNYPINPTLRITNRSSVMFPGGTEFQFDLATAAPANAKDQSGYGLSVIQVGHAGNNVGGLKGDFNRVSVKLPNWKTLPAGASTDISFVYYLPLSGPANYTVTLNGKTYAIRAEQPYLPYLK
ncbi:chitinase [Chitinivorax tropicus]|uniref:Chitinase n=1 Tax=Chitinivorax tropicus TaxID=714531 RepID=A0A840MPL0_9PROT|nr:glycosyl hydrolase family 18 protein [Chitinivorax tropicus]MBB5017181.1 chitinase [Chitinivorax tropicus]